MSWRTTLAAIVLALSAVFNAAGSLLDDNESTNPNWTLLLAQIGSAWGFLMARDNNVTSEEVGLKGPVAQAEAEAAKR